MVAAWLEERTEVAPTRRRPRLDTPTRLWLLLVTAVAAVLTVGLVTGFSLAGRESTAAHTAQSTEALVAEVQELSYSLADANATAATAVLVGPETPAQFTARYDNDIAAAEKLLSVASQQVAGDAYASSRLQSVAEQIPEYTGLIGQALADNRLGYPVTGAFLRQASLMLTGSMLTETGQVATAEQNAANAGIGSAAAFPWWVLALGALAILALWLVARRLTEISRRRINPGLLGATIAVVALLGWSLYAFGGARIESSGAKTDFTAISQAQNEISQLALAETYIALQQIDRGEDEGADERSADTALSAAVPLSGSVEGDSPTTLALVKSAYYALDQCANQAIQDASQGDYQTAIADTVGSGAKVGEGGCEPLAGALRGDLQKVFSESQAQFDKDMASLGSEYAGSGALPIGIVIGVVGAAAAAFGVNRRLAEFR